MPTRIPRRPEEDVLKEELGAVGGGPLPETPPTPPMGAMEGDTMAPVEPVADMGGPIDPVVGEMTTAIEGAMAELDIDAGRDQKIDAAIKELKDLKGGGEPELGGLGEEEGLGLDELEEE